MLGRFSIGYERVCRAILIAFTINIAAVAHTLLGLIVAGLFPSIGAMCGLWRTWLLEPSDRAWSVRETWIRFHREWKAQLKSANLLGWPMAVLWGLFLYDYWIVNWHDAGMVGYACAGILLMAIVVYGLFSMLVWVVRANFAETNRWCVRMTLQMLLARPLCSLALFAVFVLSVAMLVRWPGMLVVFGLSLPMLAGTACVYWFGRLPGMDVRESESYRRHHAVTAQ